MLKKGLMGFAFVFVLTNPAIAKNGKMTFQQMDTNKNGAVEPKEMQDSVRKSMKKVDKDNNNIITVEEVLAMMPMYVRPLARGKVTSFLKSQDINKNGHTHISEMQSHAQKLFKAHDKNKDNKLSKAEYAALQKARY